MRRLPRVYLLFLLSLTAISAAFAADGPGTRTAPLMVKRNWTLQSSAKINAAGADLSQPGFKTEGWYKTTVPSTVVSTLVAIKVYTDPNFGTNLRNYPGMNYPVGDNLSNLDVPEDSPFRPSWWYRTEFTVPAAYAGKTIWLHLDALNYRANIWLNGQQIGDAKEIVGTFRKWEFDVTRLAKPGKVNALAVEVFVPGKDDLAITWVDWNPMPPDKEMGLWKDVYLSTTGPVSLRNPFVNPSLAADHKTADLAILADLRNATDKPVKGTLRVQIGTIQVSEPVELGPAEAKTVRIDAAKHAQLKISNPKLWWPYQMGAPNLYTAKLAFVAGGAVSDSSSVNFGIREVKSEINSSGARQFSVNGKKILIRGAAYTPDMLMLWKPAKVEAEMRLSKHLGLNTIRLEGKMERDEFFDITDRMGLLVMPGWCCCDTWEMWSKWKDEQYRVAGASLEDQIRRLRTHPSIFVWLNGSDGPPPANVEKMYLAILKKLDWPNPSISSAAADSTTVTGPSGVKMTGPYDYEPPNYWLVDKEAGGAYGYNTETSPGPAIPTLQSLKRFIPEDHLWPIDDVWNYHAGGERFTNMTVYQKGMDGRYGKPENLEDYLRKSQAMAYEGQRAMFEAYGRNKYVSTGVIQWMLNNAWPSLIWHLWDYYLVPAGGYFGSKKALEPVHVQYSYDDHSVAVVNSKYEAVKGLKISARIYNLDASEKHSQQATVDVPADGVAKAFALPKPEGLDTTYFLRLEARDSAGRLVSDNFYWLSTKEDKMDWKGRKDTAFTPQAEYGDLTGLNNLPKVKLFVLKSAVPANPGALRVTVRNTGKAIAFMVHLRLAKTKGGEDITPVFWDENYFSLLPGESRQVGVTYDVAAAGGKAPVLEVDGWNVEAEPVAAAAK